jgi:hypothetical protein
MKKTTIFFSILLLTSTAAALNLQIDAKDKFELNETIQANYTINVDEAKEVSYISSFQCSTIPIGFPQRNTVQVPEEGYTNTKVLVNVTERYSSQNCNFSVSTTSPEEITRQKTLKIETDPKIDLELLLCTDEDCNNQSKTFQKGKTVYIDYSSNVDSTKVTGEITEPGGKQIKINPPQKIELTEKGTYSVEIKSEKQGYRSTVETTNFAAIDEYSLNDSNETSEVSEKPKNESGNTIKIVALLIGFLAALLGVKYAL